MKPITEEMQLEKEWYKEACEVRYETLMPYLDKLMGEYDHDYGSIVKAMCAGMMATLHAMNNDERQGRITGFQSSCLMWELIKRFNLSENKCGARLINFDDLLYPQFGDKFNKVISDDIWQSIRNEAKEKIKNSPDAHEEVIAHWKSIVDGKIPHGFKVEKEV